MRIFECTFFYCYYDERIYKYTYATTFIYLCIDSKNLKAQHALNGIFQMVRVCGEHHPKYGNLYTHRGRVYGR